MTKPGTATVSLAILLAPFACGQGDGRRTIDSARQDSAAEGGLQALQALSDSASNAQLGSLLRELESKSGFTDADTIHVFFRQGDPRFAGTALDTAVYSNFAEHYPEYGEIFATYHFRHSPGRVGYLLRVPSQYSSTALDLWIYDSTSARFLEPLRVADKFGDGLWRFTEDGWLVDIDGDGVRDLVQRRRDRWLDDETDEAHESDSLFVSLWSSSSYPKPSLSRDARLGALFDIPDWSN